MKKILYAIPCLFLFISCQEENVGIPDTGRKIVINGLISTDSLINLRISKSFYYKDYSMLWEFPEFDSAEVLIYKNDFYTDSLYYTNQRAGSEIYPKSNYKSGKIIPQSDNEYTIRVRRRGFPDAMSATRIPSLVKIERVDTTRIATADLDFILNCRIEFNDPSAEKNYYLVNVIETNLLNNIKFYREFDCYDPVIEEELGSSQFAGKILKFGYAFSDKLIDGKKYNLAISFKIFSYWDSPHNPNPRTSHIYYIRLISITEDYFRFIQTLNLFNKTYMNPLAEPVMVHSNVSGGYGIFSGAAVSSDSIIIHD